MKGKVILLISPESWGKSFVSKHHYANYLAKHNTVYFLNPASNSIFNPFGSVNVIVAPIKENLNKVNYQNLLPKLNNLPKFLQRHFYRKQAKQIQKALNIEKFDIVWSFDPYRFWNQKFWKTDKSIYHTVDVHFTKCFELDISKSSSIVLLSSELLRKKLEFSNSNIYYSGHASDIDNFEKNRDKKNITFPGFNKIKAGLVGNFNNNVDYNLIFDIAEHNMQIDFIFIGPFETNNLGYSKSTKDTIILLEQLSNVFFIGEIPSENIHGWLINFDINLVLYKEEKRDIIINPHKMMGYFYTGKITICSWFNEYKDEESEFVYITKNNKDIPEAIKKVSTNLQYWNDIQLQQKRKQFAINNTYDKKIEEIGKILYTK